MAAWGMRVGEDRELRENVGIIAVKATVSGEGRGRRADQQRQEAKLVQDAERGDFDSH